MTTDVGTVLLERFPVQDQLAASDDLTTSAITVDSRLTSNQQVDAWLDERRRANEFRVTLSPLNPLPGWRFLPDRGDLVHDTGRFFSIEGLQVLIGDREWTQPIINQPEIGILGILVKKFDGVLHCLMQAKMEPGNVNLIQLSPTVQATHSNYTGVHGGRPTPYLAYFQAPPAERVLVDALQSEQAAWFLRKRNRNMVVETTEEVPEHEDFRWLTLGQIRRLLNRDNVVNMDSRTVLSCIPFGIPPGRAGDDRYRTAIRRSISGAPGLHRTEALLSQITESRTRVRHVQRSIPLNQVTGWHRSDDEITHHDGRYFRIVGATVTAGNREVGQWSQPLLAPPGDGVTALLVKEFDGVLHLLVQTRPEAGSLAGAELGPTVQCTPGNYRDRPPPPFLDEVRTAPPERVLHDTVQSEEGGRFYHTQNRYLIVEAPENLGRDVPPNFIWITVAQAIYLLRHGNYLNVYTRSLILALHNTWPGLTRTGTDPSSIIV